VSSYYSEAVNPDTGKVEVALFIDGHFGSGQFGVKFDRDGPIYPASEVSLTTGRVLRDEPELECADDARPGFGELIIAKNRQIAELEIEVRRLRTMLGQNAFEGRTAAE
jgi:hypothetical protein